MNISEELERSFGDGPPLPPLEATLAAGRRRLALQRVRNGAAGFAAVAVLAAGGFVLVGGDDPGSPQPAQDPSPVPTQEPTEEPADPPWPRGTVVRYVDDELQVRPGATVHEHLENPYHYAAPGLSDALDLTWRGDRQWVIIERDPVDGSLSESGSQPSNGWASFADYVADQVATATGTSGDPDHGWPATFELADDGRVVPTTGTVVHNRTDDPRLGPTFAPAGATTGAAIVSVPGDPNSYFVVWRVIDGALDVIYTSPEDQVGATFEELLTMARAQYSSGEGLR